jgi:CBS domain-containing protein
MKSSRVDIILLPLTEELPLEPSVATGEKISRAIELMVSHNLNRIAVVRNRRAIGMIRLEDAFQEIGLEMPARS